MDSKQLVEAFGILFNEAGPETPEEIDEYLAEMGYNPYRVGLRFKAIADWAISKVKKFYEGEHTCT